MGGGSSKKLHKQLAELEAENHRLRQENDLLRQKVDLLIRKVFGQKSEKLDPAQLQLMLGNMDEQQPEDPEVSAPEPGAEAEAKPLKARARRPRIPDHLPVVEEVLVPEPVKVCPEAWRCIGEETSEQLDYEPGRFLRRRTIRRKYVKRSDRSLAPIVAPMPERLIERGLMAPGLLAHITISKYADHLSLYRQEQIYRQRYGVQLPRQTLCRAVMQVADWLQLIVQEMSREQFAGNYLQIDETPIRYLEPGAGKARQGYLWTAHVPGGDTVYHWHPGRGHERLMTMVPSSFRGIVQCDGYSAYGTFASKRPGIELAGRWAHVRRKFHEALQGRDSPEHAGWVLEQIRALYRVEEGLRHSRAGPEERARTRQEASRPIVEELRQTLTNYQLGRVHVPQSLMGKAVNYALGQWPALLPWLEHGEVEIDNNLVENAIRPTAVGKKNWLFIGSEEAGWCGAVIYSVITTCRNRGIDPHAYLRDVLRRLPAMTNHQIPQITPAAWAAAQQDAAAEAS